MGLKKLGKIGGVNDKGRDQVDNQSEQEKVEEPFKDEVSSGGVDVGARPEVPGESDMGAGEDFPSVISGKKKSGGRRGLFIFLIIVILIAVGVGVLVRALSNRKAGDEEEKQQVKQVEEEKEEEEVDIEAATRECLEKNEPGLCVKYQYDDALKKCVEGEVTPCCSNNVCEAGELTSCLNDCQRIIEQGRHERWVEVGYFSEGEGYQRAVQTWVAPEVDGELTEVGLFIEEVKGNGYVYLEIRGVDDEDQPWEGDVIGETVIPTGDLVAGQMNMVRLDAGLVLVPGQTYALDWQVKSKVVEVRLGRSMGEAYEEGQGWYWVPQTNEEGEVLDKEMKWRRYKDDMSFRLVFRLYEQTVAVPSFLPEGAKIDSYWEPVSGGRVCGSDEACLEVVCEDYPDALCVYAPVCHEGRCACALGCQVQEPTATPTSRLRR